MLPTSTLPGTGRQSRWCRTHFTDEEGEAQRGPGVTRPTQGHSGNKGRSQHLNLTRKVPRGMPTQDRHGPTHRWRPVHASSSHLLPSRLSTHPGLDASALQIWQRSMRLVQTPHQSHSSSFSITHRKIGTSSVSVRSGPNKVSQTRWLINNRNVLLTYLEAGVLIPRCPPGQSPMRAFFPVSDANFLLYSPMAGKKQSESKLSCLLFMLISIYLLGCTGSKLQHEGSSVFMEACGIFSAACGILLPDQGLNPDPLDWGH